jgi:hypothetical protein
MTQVFLIDVTRELLRNRPRNLLYDDIAKDTGLHPGWINSFAKRAPADAHSRKVQILYEYLAKCRLIAHE